MVFVFTTINVPCDSVAPMGVNANSRMGCVVRLLSVISGLQLIFFHFKTMGASAVSCAPRSGDLPFLLSLRIFVP